MCHDGGLTEGGHHVGNQEEGHQVAGARQRTDKLENSAGRSIKQPRSRLSIDCRAAPSYLMWSPWKLFSTTGMMADKEKQVQSVSIDSRKSRLQTPAP